jgi:hypothetical protein
MNFSNGGFLMNISYVNIGLYQCDTSVNITPIYSSYITETISKNAGKTQMEFGTDI